MELILPLLAVLPAVLLVVVFLFEFIGFMGADGMTLIAGIIILSVAISALLVWGMWQLQILGYL